MKLSISPALGKLAKNLVGPRLFNLRFLFSAPLAYAPGHFYSPICDPAELRYRYRDPRTVARPDEIPEIDLAQDSQVALWESWVPLFHDVSRVLANDPSQRYTSASRAFGIGDAFIYSCMLYHFRPERLIEVGSGSSSAVALDVFDRLFPKRPRVTFIEPYPDLLESLLKPEDKGSVEIVRSCVQDVEPKIFDDLQKNDVLLIDSTHIVKTGSDVVFELFEILPRLRPGVIVHFHDVFYPFEYPREWVIDGNYSWNELYTLRAFLMGNRHWEILFFNDYFAYVERSRVERDAPQILGNPGGSLWLRRR